MSNDSVERANGLAEQQREVERAQVSIPARWGTAVGIKYEAMITSLSIKGCLVQTDLMESLSEKPLFLYLQLMDGEQLLLHGEALYFLRGVGFGMVFKNLDKKTQEMLREMVQYHL